EVADPRKRIAADEPGEQPPRVLRSDRGSEPHEPERSADEVQPAARPVRVLGKIERIKVGEGRVLRVGLCHAADYRAASLIRGIPSRAIDASERRPSAGSTQPWPV